MRRFLRELGSLGSRAFNVFTGGRADVTFSARSHKEDLWTEKHIDTFFWLVKNERGHCERWFQEDLKRARELLIEAEELRARDN